MEIEEVFFSNSENEQLTNLSSIAQQVFHTWNLEDEESHTDTHIVQHFICNEPSMMFAHMALTRILDFQLRENEKIHWRKHLVEGALITSLSDFRLGVEECLNLKIVHHIIDQLPQTLPEFLGGGFKPEIEHLRGATE